MYADLSGPLHKMPQVGKFDGRKGSKKKLAWTMEVEEAFNKLKERLLGQLGIFLMDPDKGIVLRTDTSDYAGGAVLEQLRCDGTHVPVAFWSRVLAEGQHRTWTARRRRLMPLCVRSRNGWATSNFNPWFNVPIINHFRVGTRSIRILPRVQRQGGPHGTRPLRNSTLASSMSPGRTTL